MWRITGDFWDQWRQQRETFERAKSDASTRARSQAGSGHAAPGRAATVWEVPERTCFTTQEQRAMMTLWRIVRSSLMMGGEVTKNSDFTLLLLTNRDVPAMEKDRWGTHPLRATEEETVRIAPRRDSQGFYAALFILSGMPRRVSLSREKLEGVPAGAKDLWNGRTYIFPGALPAELQPHEATVFHRI